VGITGAKEWLDDPNNGLKEVNFRFDDHMTRDFGVISALTCHFFSFLFNCRYQLVPNNRRSLT
jgi:hypothetical protein